MNEELSAALTAMLIALVGAITSVIGVVAVHAPKLLRAWFEARREQTAATRAQRVERASDQAVQAAEEIGRAKGLKGPQKLSLASEIAGRNIEPELRPTEELLQASVARLRQSSSSGLTPVVLSTPPAGSSINVVVTSSSEPPPLPAPAKVPSSWREDAPTNPQVRR